MTSQTTTCPICKYPIEIDIEWAAKNGRVFCGTCGKSFEVGLRESSDKALEELSKLLPKEEDDNHNSNS